MKERGYVQGDFVPKDPTVEITRTILEPDWEIPIFTKDRAYVERFV